MASQLEMYQARQNEIVKEYNGEIIAIKDGEVQGKFDSLVEAYRAMLAKGYSEGEYMIIRCTPGDSEYTAWFANWHVFAGASHAR